MKTGKVIIITGTSRGLGKGLTTYYLKKNFIVVGCSRRRITFTHKNYSHYTLDIADEKAVVKMVRETVRKHGEITVLINNAGLASMNHLVLTPVNTVNKIFNTNFLGAYLFIREVSKMMIKQKHGRIINFSTVAVPLNLEGESIYAASKAAIESLTRISAKELGKFGITVNALGPTPIQTDLIKNVPEGKINALIENQAIKRMGTIEDVINTIDFFIAQRSCFVTGQIIYLGGIIA